MISSQQSGIVCRLIAEDALDGVVECLTRGFPERPKTYWTAALDRLSRRPEIADHPRYGYALFSEGVVVGVLLQIVSRADGAPEGAIRSNLSSWCVDKEHRGYAPLLHMTSVRRKEATYLNISPAMHTRKVIEAFGFRRYSNGQIVAAPLLSPREPDVSVRPFVKDGPDAGLLPAGERALLADHAVFGCRVLLCVKDGAAYPFVFLDRKIFRRLVPCPQLIYCRGLDEFVRFAGAIGRHLMFRTGPFCLVDAAGPMAGLAGKYFAERAPKYFKGPTPPRLGDLSYTELVLFGS
jgi:hypothetical protein